MIQLDTSFLILGLVPESPQSRRLRGWLEEGETLAISTIGWAEFLCGPVTPSAAALAERILQEPIPFQPADASLAADLFNHSGRRRGTLVDCMIAATALRAEAALATANTADFRAFESLGLQLAA